MAQIARITGEVYDRDTKEAMMQTTVQLLHTDSVFVGGAVTDVDGKFSLAVPKAGRYLIKITSVGYKTHVQQVQVADGKDIALPRITMGADAIMLKGATVTAQAQKVVLKEDTFVYNAAAFRTPEGSTIEELVKRIPGAEVTDDGTIKINGKEVKKILVDGKEFMTGDTQTALKNLPTSIVDRIKSYDQKSDLARATGIDDGEEETVLDFGVKPGMNKGLFSNIDLGMGNHGRYAERVMFGLFRGDHRLMGFGSANNVGDRGFPGGGGRGGWGGNNNGLRARKMVGLNYNYEKKDHLTLDASLRWNHNNNDILSHSATEYFVARTGSFANSMQQNYSRSNSWDGRLRLEWKPDTLTTISSRMSVSLSSNDGLSSSASASYNDDPYLYVANPLSADAIRQLAQDSLMVNTQGSTGVTYSDSNGARGMLQVSRKLSDMGRNITVQANARYTKSDAQSVAINNAHLYLVKTLAGLDSTYETTRYQLTPSRNYSLSAQATYSEPLMRQTWLQFSYKFTYSMNKSDRSTFDFSPLGVGYFGHVSAAYRGWDSYLGLLPQALDYYLDTDLSRYSEYHNYQHELALMLRVVRPKYNLNAGVMLLPQRSDYKQDFQGVHVDTTRTVTNFSPTLDFRYRFSKVSNLRINYRGSSSQPSISQLLDITDDSNPLNISKGNPGLKPSFTNNFRLFYNNYIENHQKALMTFVNFSTTQNAISNKVTYDDATGGRTTRPENINGNWNVNGAFMYNMAIDSTGYWNINTFTNANFSNNVGFVQLNQQSDSQRNRTRTLTLGERMSGSYRNSWLEIELNGSLNYTHARNQLQSQSNLDTWQFSYGGSITLNAPWGSAITTGLTENSRRGFSDASMNTNELVWNAQVSQSFLKGRPLTVSLQFYDILHQQSNLSRTINAMQRSDTDYNNINFYAMFHVIYRLNLFGGKDAHRGGPGHGGPEGGHGGRPNFGGGGFRPGGGPGGFGGRHMF